MSTRDVCVIAIRSMVLVGSAVTIGTLALIVACDGDGGEGPLWPRLHDLSEPSPQFVLPTTRTSWHIAAEPYQLQGQDYTRGKLLWHTPRELRPYFDIYDDDADAGQSIVRTLRLIYRPAESANSWAGITAPFEESIPDSIDHFEIRVLGERGKLYFDFGCVNEDINDDGFAFTEDMDQNGAVTEEEDVGLDGLDDEQEPGYDPVTNPDPSGDNWYFMETGKCPYGNGCDTIDWNSDEWYYEFLNGTEGNRYDPSVVGLPDAERLYAGPYIMQLTDKYLSFCVDLSTDSFLVAGSEFNDWRTFRIPIRDSRVIDTLMSDWVVDLEGLNWQELRHARVWFESDESQTQPDTVEIAQWRFTRVEE